MYTAIRGFLSLCRQLEMCAQSGQATAGQAGEVVECSSFPRLLVLAGPPALGKVETAKV